MTDQTRPYPLTNKDQIDYEAAEDQLPDAPINARLAYIHGIHDLFTKDTPSDLLEVCRRMDAINKAYYGSAHAGLSQADLMLIAKHTGCQVILCKWGAKLIQGDSMILTLNKKTYQMGLNAVFGYEVW